MAEQLPHYLLVALGQQREEQYSTLEYNHANYREGGVKQGGRMGISAVLVYSKAHVKVVT